MKIDPGNTLTSRSKINKHYINDMNILALAPMLKGYYLEGQKQYLS
jgi:hypothetical protein